jgi:AraC family transcriptional regulator
VDLKGAKPLKYQLVELPAFRVVGLREIIHYDCDAEENPSNEISQFWARVGNDGTIGRLMGLNNGIIKGLLGMTVEYNQEKNNLEYWVGTASNDDVPEDLCFLEISAEKWAVFEMVGPVAEVLPKTWQKIYSEWFPSNDYEHSNAPSLEVYKSSDPASPDARTEIWIPVK